MIKKKELKSKPVCKVTFGLSKKRVPNASRVNLVGEFNGWSETDTEMTKMKSGDFKIEMSLDKGQNYQFRYLVDGQTWINDDTADSYVNSGIGQEDNCVVSL